MSDPLDRQLDDALLKRQEQEAAAAGKFREKKIADTFKSREIETGTDATGRAYPLPTERNRTRGIQGVQPDPVTGQVNPAARDQWAAAASTLPDVESIRSKWKDIDTEASHARQIARARERDEKTFSERFKDSLDFQPGGQDGDEIDIGPLRTEIDQLERESKKTRGFLTKEPAPEAIAAQEKLGSRKKDYDAILQQRQRIKSMREQADTRASELENMAFEAYEQVLGASRASWKQSAADASIQARAAGGDLIDAEATAEKMDEAQGEIFTAFNLDRGDSTTPEVYNGRVLRPGEKISPAPERYHRIYDGKPDGSAAKKTPFDRLLNQLKRREAASRGTPITRAPASPVDQPAASLTSRRRPPLVTAFRSAVA